MIDTNYSKYSPIHNSDIHSARNMRVNKKTPAKTSSCDFADSTFLAFSDGHLNSEELLAALGVDTGDYKPTENIKTLAIAVKVSGKIDSAILARILSNS